MSTQLSEHFTYKKLLLFCVSPILMMLFTSIYSVVDGFFISNFAGKLPFTAVNLVWPVLMILGSVGFMIGAGGTALIAKTQGEGKNELANQIFSLLLLFALVLGTLISLLGFVFFPTIARWLGATPALMTDAVRYGRVMMLFNLAFIFQYMFQVFFPAAGKPTLGLYFTIAGGLTNMVLDALFVAVFHWGATGAALATGLSQVVAGVLPFFYFARSNGSTLRITSITTDFSVLIKTCTNGMSELMNQIANSLVSIVYNWQLLRYAAENGVAAYGVLMFLQFVFTAVFIGYTMGTAPIIAFHYGAQNTSELKNLLKKSFVLNFGAGLLMSVLGIVLANAVAKIFVGYDAELLALTAHAFRIFSVSFVLAGLNIFMSSFFTALNNGTISAVIAFMRALVFQLIAVLVLPLLFGLEGIWWAISVAEVLSLVVALSCLARYNSRYHYF